jgi:hypothetical protein
LYSACAPETKQEYTMMRQYTALETLVANLPYMAMVVLGTGTIAVSLGATPWALGGAVGYFTYGVAGAFWIMIFMCPSCAYYGTRECPCGYGMISSRLVRQREQACFSKKFKIHIPVIVPIWLIPAACGGYALYRSFSWPLLVLLFSFIIDSYIILPLVAKSHSCAECPQKEDCPWMAK